MAKSAAALLGTGFITAAVTGALLTGAPAAVASPEDGGSTSSSSESSSSESAGDTKPDPKPDPKPDTKPDAGPDPESDAEHDPEPEPDPAPEPEPEAVEPGPDTEPAAGGQSAPPTPTSFDDNAPKPFAHNTIRSAPRVTAAADATVDAATVTGEVTVPTPDVAAAVPEADAPAAPVLEPPAALTADAPDRAALAEAIDVATSEMTEAPAPASSGVGPLTALALNVLAGVVHLFGGPPALPATGGARMSAVPADAGRAVDADWSYPEAAPAAPMAEAEPVFTGQPSIFTQVFVAGLRLIKPVLAIFGIELNGTSARIPFFTDGVPPFFVTGGLNVTATEYEGWKVWTIAPPNPSEKVVIGAHGGSFISTASLFHWETYADTARKTGATVVVPLYPLANADGTGGTAKTVVPLYADFIAAQVAEHGADNVSVFGDSAGGSIALAAVQEIVRRCGDDAACRSAQLPGRMVLLSPALDASASNPAINDIDDPLLSPASSKRNGLWWARGLETVDDPDGTRNPLASPVYGSLQHLPPITVYAGSIDLRTPDVLVLRERAIAEGADITFELRAGQFHDWPIFGFLPDAHVERANIHRDLGLT